MLSLLRTARHSRPIPHIRRFAEQVTSLAIVDPSAPIPNLPDNIDPSPPAIIERKESGITLHEVEPYVNINPKHGLWYFFREFYHTDSKEWKRTTLEPKKTDGYSGRSWSAPELRRKSFKDLHTLWYVLLRERNLLATQKEEARRIGVASVAAQTDIPWHIHQCKKSMARIKYVLNERRLAYEGAVERFARDKTLGRLGATAEREARMTKKGMNQKATKKGDTTHKRGKQTGRPRTQARRKSEAAQEDSY